MAKHYNYSGWALVPLRLMVGFGFAAHGYAKLSRGPGTLPVDHYVRLRKQRVTRSRDALDK